MPARFAGARVLLSSALGLGVLICAAGSGSPLAAQTEEVRRYNGSGYATFGIGQCSHKVANVSTAFGGDAFVWRGLTVGGDAGYYKFAGDDYGFGVATATVGYHFVNRSRPGRFEPFVYLGIPGIAFNGSGRTAAVALGGGVTYWVSRRIGIRTELRGAGFEDESIGMFRIGISFR